MFFLSASYNSTQTYSDAAVEEAVERWRRLATAYDRATDALAGADARTTADSALGDRAAESREAFAAAMNDDFNTREALAALFDLAGAVNTHLDDAGAYDYRGLRAAVETFEELGEDVLGFAFGGDAGGGEATLTDELVELVLDVRERERAAGNYDRADALRDDLEALGVDVQDTDDGPTYSL
jgi:cysteinyl-tRNA synthetase